MSGSNCCFLTCIQVSQEADKLILYSHLFQNFPQFVVIHIVNVFSVVNEAEVDVFLNFLVASLGFSMKKIMTYVNSESFASFPISIPFISFSSRIAVAS